MRVIVTGSRDWTDMVPVSELMASLPSGSTIVEGGARGLDRLARDLAHAWGFSVETFWANWKYRGKGEGPARNQRMIDSGADLVAAFPLQQSVGTWDCVRRARAAGIEVKVYGQDN